MSKTTDELSEDSPFIVGKQFEDTTNLDDISQPCADHLPKITKQQIKHAFNKIDLDNSGTLTLDEFESALKLLNLPFSSVNAKNILKACDIDGDGMVSYDEFEQFSLQQVKTGNLRTFLTNKIYACGIYGICTFIFCKMNDYKIRKVFTSLDIDNSGTLSSDELNNALKNELNISLDNKQLKEFMSNLYIIKDTLTAEVRITDEILFEEFRSKLLLLPNTNTISDIFEVYRPDGKFDIGESSYTIPSDYSNINNFLSGGIAGVFSRTITAPGDRIKIILQSGLIDKNENIINTINKLYKEGGIKAFWRGNGVNCIKIMPETAIKFGGYQIIKNIICKDKNNPKTYERFISGSFAGFLSTTIVYPLEIAKTRLAVATTGQYNGIIHCLKSVVKNEGFKALYNGWNASVMGIMPYAGVDLGMYFTLKEFVSKRRKLRGNNKKISSLQILCMGAISSMTGQFVAYPLQTLRTKLQTQGHIMEIKLDNGLTEKIIGLRYNGFIDCFRVTLKNEGIKGLYRGLLVNFSKAVPAIALSYVAYEKTRNFLSNFL